MPAIHPTVPRFLLLALWLGADAAASHAQQWLPLGGPEGGTVTALAYHPATGAMLAGTGVQTSYIVTPNAGSVYRSLDRGATWQDVSQDITAAAPTTCRVRGLSVSPLAGAEILAGLDGGGVFRSVDAGLHWSALNAGLTRPFIRAVAHDSTGARYAATDTAGVFTMSAAGATWAAINTGLTSLRTNCLAFGPGYVLVGTADLGVFKRVGAGSWAGASVGLPAASINKLIRTGAGALYAATGAGLYVSSDDAANWTPAPGGGVVAGIGIRSVFESGNTLVAGGDTVVYRSVAGNAWETITAGFTGFGPAALGADPLGRIYCGTLDRGVLVSDDGAQTWAESNTGIRAHSIHRMVVTPAGMIVAGTRTGGIVRSTDGGATWEPPPAGLEHRLIFALNRSPWGDLYAGNYTIANNIPDGHAWRSTDEGATWSPLDNGMVSSMVSGFAFSGVTGEVWNSSAWNPGGVTLSSNGGSAWNRFGPPQNIPAYCLLRTPSGDLYFGSEGQQVWKYQASTNQWQAKGLQQSQQFALARDSVGNIFVGNDRNLKGFYRSTDDGATFQPLVNFPGNEGYAMLVLPNDELYAGTSGNGIQHSTDHGDTWTTANTGMPNGACFALALGPDARIYAGGAGGGVFRSATPVSCAASITQQPQPASSCPGGSASFTITASVPSPAVGSSGAISYQWRRNGAPLAGATQPTLTLNPVMQSDDATYDCLLTTPCGTVASAAARLRICPGDSNTDGVVNTADLTVLLGSFGQSVAPCADGDQNADGTVNTADLVALLAMFGQACP